MIGYATNGTLASAISSAIVKGARQHRAALLLFAILQLADVASTFAAFRVGMWEANPVAALALTVVGEANTYALKLALVTAVLVAVCLLQERFARVWRVVHIGNLAMAFLVFSNVAQIMISI